MVLFSKVRPVSLVLAVLALLALAHATATPDPWILTEADFTDLATQILTYLGYAVVAGLSILVAVVGARRAWGFMRRFL